MDAAVASDGSTPSIIAAENGHAGVLMLLGATALACDRSTGGSEGNDRRATKQNGNRGGKGQRRSHRSNSSEGNTQPQRQREKRVAHFDARMDGGATAAYVAACNGHADCLEILARLGADLDKSNDNGATPVYSELFVRPCQTRSTLMRLLIVDGSQVLLSIFHRPLS